VLTSYAIAEEGTNTLYLGLVDVIARRDYINDPYTLQEVEMVLNFFPHDVWQDVRNDKFDAGFTDMSPLRQKFYYPVMQRLDLGWIELSHDQFLSVVQGLTLTGPDVFTNSTANNMLNSFI
jgi:hypothetical protein